MSRAGVGRGVISFDRWVEIDLRVAVEERDVALPVELPITNTRQPRRSDMKCRCNVMEGGTLNAARSGEVVTKGDYLAGAAPFSAGCIERWR